MKTVICSRWAGWLDEKRLLLFNFWLLEVKYRKFPMLFMLSAGKWYAGSTNGAQKPTVRFEHYTPTHTSTQETENDGQQKLGTRKERTKKHTIVVDNDNDDDNFLLVRNKHSSHTDNGVGWHVCGSVGSQATTEPDVRCCFAIHNLLCIDILLVWLRRKSPCRSRNVTSANVYGVGSGRKRRGAPERMNRKQSTNTQHLRTVWRGEGAKEQCFPTWTGNRQCQSVSSVCGSAVARSIGETSRIGWLELKANTEGETLLYMDDNPPTPCGRLWKAY